MWIRTFVIVSVAFVIFIVQASLLKKQNKWKEIWLTCFFLSFGVGIGVTQEVLREDFPPLMGIIVVISRPITNIINYLIG